MRRARNSNLESAVGRSGGWPRDFRVLSFLGTGVLLEVWVGAPLGSGRGCRVTSVPLHP